MNEKEHASWWEKTFPKEDRKEKAERLGISSDDLGLYEAFAEKFYQLDTQLNLLNVNLLKENSAHSDSVKYVRSELKRFREDLKFVSIKSALILSVVVYIAWKVS